MSGKKALLFDLQPEINTRVLPLMFENAEKLSSIKLYIALYNCRVKVNISVLSQFFKVIIHFYIYTFIQVLD